MIARLSAREARAGGDQQRNRTAELVNEPQVDSPAAPAAARVSCLPRGFAAELQLVGDITRNRESGLPEIAVAAAWIDLIAAAAEHRRFPEILLHPQRQQQPRARPP